jgi:Skp family chaperone for outer membrane proteins
MAENRTTGARRRKRRSGATLERLEAARRRRAEQLEKERDNERRVDEALGPFAEAATAIETLERKLEDRQASLEAQLERKLEELDRQKAARVAEYDRLKDEVRADVDMEIAESRAVMAGAVRQIRDSEVSVSETAELLGIPVKLVTALAREGADSVDGAASGNGGDAVPGSDSASRRTGDVDGGTTALAETVRDDVTEEAGGTGGWQARSVVERTSRGDGGEPWASESVVETGPTVYDVAHQRPLHG